MTNPDVDVHYKEDSKDEDFEQALSLFSPLSAELTHASCALPVSVGCILLHPWGTLILIR